MAMDAMKVTMRTVQQKRYFTSFSGKENDAAIDGVKKVEVVIRTSP